MRYWIMGFCLLLALGGCAALKQAKADYGTGKVVLSAQGTSGTAEATKVLEPFIPFLPEPVKPFVFPVAWILGVVITWRAGVNERKNHQMAGPITGFVGSKVGLEFIVQNVVNILVGIFAIIRGVSGKGVQLASKILPTQPPL